MLSLTFQNAACCPRVLLQASRSLGSVVRTHDLDVVGTKDSARRSFPSRDNPYNGYGRWGMGKFEVQMLLRFSIACFISGSENRYSSGRHAQEAKGGWSVEFVSHRILQYSSLMVHIVHPLCYTQRHSIIATPCSAIDFEIISISKSIAIAIRN